jgi:hypothetical protein
MTSALFDWPAKNYTYINQLFIKPQSTKITLFVIIKHIYKKYSARRQPTCPRVDFLILKKSSLHQSSIAPTT